MQIFMQLLVIFHQLPQQWSLPPAPRTKREPIESQTTWGQTWDSSGGSIINILFIWFTLRLFLALAQPTPSTNKHRLFPALPCFFTHTHTLTQQLPARIVCKIFWPHGWNSKANIVWVFLVAFFLKIANEKYKKRREREKEEHNEMRKNSKDSVCLCEWIWPSATLFWHFYRQRLHGSRGWG